MYTDIVTSMFNQDLLPILTEYSSRTFPFVAIIPFVVYISPVRYLISPEVLMLCCDYARLILSECSLAMNASLALWRASKFSLINGVAGFPDNAGGLSSISDGNAGWFQSLTDKG